MKFSVVLALVAAATVVSAETNAQRLARGLAPNAPGKRATPASGGHGSSPSGTPCKTGSLYCCSSSGKSGEGGIVDELISILGIVDVQSGTLCGASCSSVGSTTNCNKESLCCDNNKYDGFINVGCSPCDV